MLNVLLQVVLLDGHVHCHNILPFTNNIVLAGPLILRITNNEYFCAVYCHRASAQSNILIITISKLAGSNTKIMLLCGSSIELKQKIYISSSVQVSFE